MAKARMLHRTISISGKVDKLSLAAKLLFTWMIPHADDEGRLPGDANVVKATVAPLSKWSLKAIKKYIGEIKNQGLIYFWEENENWFIEFVNWNRFQTIRPDRLRPSTLPSFNNKNDRQVTDKRQPNDRQVTAQYNISESNKIEENKSESNEITIAIKNPSKGVTRKTNPENFSPTNEIENAALEAWNRVEPDNPDSFDFYLWAAKQGLPTAKFYEFSSEIEQDKSIKNKGAVFNKKVADFLEGSK